MDIENGHMYASIMVRMSVSRQRRRRLGAGNGRAAHAVHLRAAYCGAVAVPFWLEITGCLGKSPDGLVNVVLFLGQKYF